jgi:hypothetical protein
MAFSLRNLSVLAYAKRFTLWHYKAESDPLDRASAKGYFAPAADLLAPGDMVMLSGAEGGKIATIAGAGKSITLAPMI